MPIKEFDLNSKILPSWCPGCGNHFILTALKQAITELTTNYEDVLVVFGVGCSGNAADFIKCYTYHALHGRPLPVATGAKLANPKLKIIAVGGDGDGYGIGLSHFIHSCRRNLDITYIVHNNQVYGLTSGQTSPTSEKGYVSKSTPSGVIEEPIHPLELAISSDATFVARAYFKDLPHMKELFLRAMNHKGFSLVDVLQICPSFKRNNTEEFYVNRTSRLEKESHDRSNKLAAWEKAHDKTKLWYGIFYEETGKPTYCDELEQINGKSLTEMYQELKEPVGVKEVLSKFC